MKMKDVALKEEYGFLQGGELHCLSMNCPWDAFRPDWKRPAVIVVPGGAYGMTSRREGIPVAAEFWARGFQVFVLNYVCAPDARYPEQLLELAAAVDYVKKNAKEFSVNEKEVFVVGFSAGGHLTANLAVEHQNVAQKAGAGAALDCKPTAVGLCYPVISQTHGHQGSFDNLLNGYPEEEKQAMFEKLSLEKAVSEQTPPAFIWATATDNAVPADNALRYALALDNHGISYELHMYPKGWHGLSTGNFEINDTDDMAMRRVSRWVEDCATYFRSFVVEKY